jgi:nitrate/TMAO reductase-like tetraheme cytochrome c subunit
MTRPSMQRLPFVVALAIVMAFGLVSRAEAQFETANRQFHNQTSFPLDGRHRDLSCESCHRQGAYKGTPAKCFDCHWTRRQDDRYRLQLGAQCEQCHRPISWRAVRWDHAGMTGMALGVSHQQLSCQSCHAKNNLRAAQTGCFACHQRDYQATTAPNHLAAGFSTTCESCHRPNDGTFHAGFNHAAVFTLVGVHAQQTCARCHLSGVYKGTPTTCVGCHLTAYNRTTNPNHAAAGFSTACESCHRNSDTSWTQATFNHRFPITSGPHRVTCTQCHTGGTFQTFSCVSCHGRTETDSHHGTIPGYRYDSLACYSCHPNGRH